MADFISDFQEVVRRGEGSPFKRERLLKKLEKFRRVCREAGADVNAHPQRKFVEALCADGHGDYPELMRQLCFARLIRGDYSNWDGWQFRNEWARAAYGPDLVGKRWRGEEVGSVAILGEQGIGDEIMYGSCIPEVTKRVRDVVVECDPRLQGVFERSFGVRTRPRSDILNRGESVKYLTQERPEERFIPMGDLPKLFRRSLSDFPRQPFLRPLPEKVERWKGLQGRVGVAWRGRTGQFKPGAFQIQAPVCLQYDAWDYEVEGMTVPECDLHNDIEDLLGICANLERVVSTTQTIVHIAGAVGCPVDVVIPPKGSSRVENAIPFRYPLDSPMPWYGSVKVYGSLHAYLRR